MSENISSVALWAIIGVATAERDCITQALPQTISQLCEPYDRSAQYVARLAEVVGNDAAEALEDAINRCFLRIAAGTTAPISPAQVELEQAVIDLP
jgi:hypothetical protein